MKAANVEIGKGEIMRRNWKLSPSDFAFLWEECRRCFYLKVVRGIYRPRTIMPKIFTVIDGAMKAAYSGKRTEEIAPGAPPGVVAYADRRVRSQPIRLPGHQSYCVLAGILDTVFRFDDGSFGIVDYKTSHPKESHVQLYGRQLEAYRCCLLNPDEGSFSVQPVSRLGLVVFNPGRFESRKVGEASLEGSMTWIEIPIDGAAFMRFLKEVASVLELPEPPKGSPDCGWCRYTGRNG